MPRYWLEHCPPPRARPPDLLWDVFISYRSVDRTWAISLYDMLSQAGYTVFLDQYILVAGHLLASQLQENLRRSAAGVLLWSSDAADSRWVEREYNAMYTLVLQTENAKCPFSLVVAKLDAEPLPLLAEASLYIEFTDYPHGPSGAALVRLLYGLNNRPLEEGAIRRIHDYEEAVKEEPSILRALTAAGHFEQIEERALSDLLAYTTSATLPALAADRLIAGGENEAALRVIEHAQATFRKSLRLKQLKGLALRRLGNIEDAILALEMLRADGHQDPETLGMLGAAWADRWEARLTGGSAGSARDALERSRDLYQLAFDTVPSDTYAGINAASKSALLGELDRARATAKLVLTRLAENHVTRGGKPASDYWTRVTEAEALLVGDEWDAALRAYHESRVAHQTELGSISSTRKQLRRLLRVLPVPEDIAEKLRAEFEIDSPTPSASDRG